MENITINKANLKHSKIILEWRNDPITIKMSLNNNSVKWDDHINWFKEKLKNKENNKIFIAMKNLSPVGVIRFENSIHENNIFDVSIIIAPKYRGQGISKIVLSKSISCLLKELDKNVFIRAYVKKENIKSNKLFKNSGFLLSKINKKTNIYILENVAVD